MGPNVLHYALHGLRYLIHIRDRKPTRRFGEILHG
jgi:hypothetical protein